MTAVVTGKRRNIRAASGLREAPEQSETRNHPHPSPLPDYREREPEVCEGRPPTSDCGISQAEFSIHPTALSARRSSARTDISICSSRVSSILL